MKEKVIMGALWCAFMLVAVLSLKYYNTGISGACYYNERESSSNKSVVQRVHQIRRGTTNILEVRLNNGHVVSGFEKDPMAIGRKKNQIDDFYFAQEGDTIIYDGDDVLEVRFKD